METEEKRIGERRRYDRRGAGGKFVRKTDDVAAVQDHPNGDQASSDFEEGPTQVALPPSDAGNETATVEPAVAADPPREERITGILQAFVAEAQASRPSAADEEISFAGLFANDAAASDGKPEPKAAPVDHEPAVAAVATPEPFAAPPVASEEELGVAAERWAPAPRRVIVTPFPPSTETAAPESPLPPYALGPVSEEPSDEDDGIEGIEELDFPGGSVREERSETKAMEVVKLEEGEPKESPTTSVPLQAAAPVAPVLSANPTAFPLPVAAEPAATWLDRTELLHEGRPLQQWREPLASASGSEPSDSERGTVAQPIVREGVDVPLDEARQRFSTNEGLGNPAARPNMAPRTALGVSHSAPSVSHQQVRGGRRYGAAIVTSTMVLMLGGAAVAAVFLVRGDFLSPSKGAEKVMVASVAAVAPSPPSAPSAAPAKPADSALSEPKVVPPTIADQARDILTAYQPLKGQVLRRGFRKVAYGEAPNPAGQVEWAQQALNLVLGKKIAVDDQFGPKTGITVFEFQAAWGGYAALEQADVGKATWGALKASLERIRDGQPAIPPVPAPQPVVKKRLTPSVSTAPSFPSPSTPAPFGEPRPLREFHLLGPAEYARSWPEQSEALPKQAAVSSAVPAAEPTLAPPLEWRVVPRALLVVIPAVIKPRDQLRAAMAAEASALQALAEARVAGSPREKELADAYRFANQLREELVRQYGARVTMPLTDGERTYQPAVIHVCLGCGDGE